MLNQSEKPLSETDRESRIQLLQNALQDVLKKKDRLEEMRKRYPTELEIGGHYRVLLDQEGDIERLLSGIRAEINRLEIPGNPMYEHMNLFSGVHS